MCSFSWFKLFLLQYFQLLLNLMIFLSICQTICIFMIVLGYNRIWPVRAYSAGLDANSGPMAPGP